MSELERELRAILECRDPGYPFPERPSIPNTAAVLALFQGRCLLESELLLIKRSQTVSTHAGHVALPGGVADSLDQGDFLRTALRETREEVGIPENAIRVLGPLPALPTATGDFSVVPVLGVLEPEAQDSALRLDSREVEHAGWARFDSLRGSRMEQVREVRGSRFALPEFAWGKERMWGLTALIFDLILKRYDRIKAC
jgi:8-oxo-dGTP pyrophosphatase MutT (NUDIX family)